MPAYVRAEWRGLKESLDFFGRLGATAASFVGPGVGRAAIRAQASVRNYLENMVYAQPPASSGYQRTRTLMRSVHAANLSADHSADEGRASGGTDLAATVPESVVESSGDVLASDIGSWISYARYVHDGSNQPQSRPFAKAALLESAAALEEEIMAAILGEFATAPRG